MLTDHLYFSFKLSLVVILVVFSKESVAMHIKKIAIADTQAIVVIVDSRQDNLQVFLNDHNNKPYKSFDKVNQALKQKKQALQFAMNAGMFHSDYLPVGLYIEAGQVQFPLNTGRGTGNFFLEPNGVFLQDVSGFKVLSTQDYAASDTYKTVKLATQSGPLLVYQGQINPYFLENSLSTYVRNAVGIISEHQAAFVITEQPVNFYQLADFFKNMLQVKNALYLDGSISSLYLPEIGRYDNARFLGPMIGVLKQP